jgi:hypothetical protein
MEADVLLSRMREVFADLQARLERAELRAKELERENGDLLDELHMARTQREAE